MLLKRVKYISFTILALLTCLLSMLGAADLLVPKRQSYYIGDKPKCISIVTLSASDDSVSVSASSSHIKTEKMNAKLFGLLPLKEVSVDYYDKCTLCLGGFPFGVRFYTDGIVVVKLADIVTESGAINPAYKAGLRESDIITKCNGKKVSGAEELTDMIEKSNGKDITVTYSRGGKEYEAVLTPAYSVEDKAYKTGMWIRDSGAGIGTVTYVNPADNSFGGLGHGICDSSSGELVPMESGTLMEVVLGGIVKGVSGTPGEIKGSFGTKKLGKVFENTECGVFGVYSSRPEEAGDVYSIGLKNEVREGPATLFCTLDGEGRKGYDIEISSINKNASEDSNKCFTIKVTDNALIEIAGGIIQGMSGSPIVQNGKLVGAVTHVMINDPTAGYGIFIENMLSKVG